MPLESKYAVRLGIIAGGVAIGLVLRQLAPPQTDVTTDESRSGGARPASAAAEPPPETSNESGETNESGEAEANAESSASADSR